MFDLSPWTLARRAAEGRRITLLLVIAALLYGFGLHAARACVPTAAVAIAAIDRAGGDPCHGEVDLTQAACEAHCRTDTQSGRTSFGFDLPAALPLDLAPTLAAAVPIGPLALAAAPSRRDTGPPLHILLHRLLR
jgi:hypothetical protein